MIREDIWDEVDQGPVAVATIIDEKDIFPVVAKLKTGLQKLEAAAVKYAKSASSLDAEAEKLEVKDATSLSTAADIVLLAKCGKEEVASEMEAFIETAHSIHSAGTKKRKAIVDAFNAAAEKAKKKADAYRLHQKRLDDEAAAKAEAERKAAEKAEKLRLEKAAETARLQAEDEKRRLAELEAQKMAELKATLPPVDTGDSSAAEVAENARRQAEVEAKIKKVQEIAEKERAEIEAAAEKKAAELKGLAENVYIPVVTVPTFGGSVVGQAGELVSKFVLAVQEIYSITKIAEAVIAGRLPISVLKVDEKELINFVEKCNKAEKDAYRPGYRADGFSLVQTVKDRGRGKK
jgi:DNA segregation ATPase FtsK/SpoIIIE-like protein